jgi:gentisate 1,2-dioxygenase
VQLVKPGEIAEAHRHTASALRFVIEGAGGYTNVQGEKLRMEHGDLVLTPQWMWHDHGHEGGVPMMWIDGHDFPFVGGLNAAFSEPFARMQQDNSRAEGYTRQRTGAMRPQRGDDAQVGLPYVYSGREARALLRDLDTEGWDPLFGTTLEYVNPITGGPTLPTMRCRLHRLDASVVTRRHRQTANLIYHVVEGAGTTQTGNETLQWTTGDIFVVPAWTWQEHRANSGSTAILFSMSDEPIFRAFSLHRVEE